MQLEFGFVNPYLTLSFIFQDIPIEECGFKDSKGKQCSSFIIFTYYVNAV